MRINYILPRQVTRYLIERVDRWFGRLSLRPEFTVKENHDKYGSAYTISTDRVPEKLYFNAGIEHCSVIASSHCWVRIVWRKWVLVVSLEDFYEDSSWKFSGNRRYMGWRKYLWLHARWILRNNRTLWKASYIHIFRATGPNRVHLVV